MPPIFRRRFMLGRIKGERGTDLGEAERRTGHLTR